MWTGPKSPKRGGFVRSQLLRITNIYFLLTISLHCQAHNWGKYEKFMLRINVFFVVVVEWLKFKLVPRAFSLAFPLPTSFPAPKQRKSPWERGWQGLYFRCCLESGPCSSPRWFRGRSAGSFPKQRLVTEFSKTPVAIVWAIHCAKNSWGKRSTEYYMWFLRKENFLFNYDKLSFFYWQVTPNGFVTLYV